MNNEFKKNELNEKQLINEKIADAMLPGSDVEFDPDEAEMLGAFQENALSEKAALDSNIDSLDENLVFLDSEDEIFSVPILPVSIKENKKSLPWIAPTSTKKENNKG
ncbi:TPA: hypothetical protein SMT83_003479 [Proteus mirabilis]|uniref:hypothetical protein n=1 Tax=Proteus mirabilis TaxID=584 RepID=UPI00217CEDA9|nr:hypothetical protein [Proteus mirabilis]MCS6748163.1 hypothetical protein [Proteus mirabilis]HEK2843882.1 hypothetical protein [Proteus mirabilis]